ncbi:ABC transporter ATP-binding protein [Paracoccus methylarcula]|uniref:ABC transporter ATP-binding protein n=1 Tax=Paracoccus methylarcula TaxID=72022 RepID=A0A3R7P4U8_9RHOB|nr:ABC transporter ATP-binding protein [Paracoccus methylarcula]RNF34842.1 ABC transporter ATP-binding protein [Paracoccus methylarcula]
MAQIILENLSHSYLPNPSKDEDWALKPMTLTWEDGGAYALLGSSGCGKSTLLNIISGLLRPSRGRVLFGDRDMTGLSTMERNIAQVFQFPVVYDTMSVRDNLAFPLRNRGLPQDQVAARVAEVAEMIGMRDMLDRRARGLTADAKQKISLGRGMVRQDVNAILFDEPLTVIDPHMKWELRTQLKDLHRRFGHTMIYVTHDQTEALTFADQVVVMYDGRVVQAGTPQALFDAPEHTFVGYFIGSPGMNLMDARIEGATAHIEGVQLPLAHGYGALEGKTQLGIRPEFLRLGTGQEGLPYTIRRIEDVGHHRIVRGHVGKADVNVIVPEGQPIPADANRVLPDPVHAHVYLDDWRVAPSNLERAA